MPDTVRAADLPDGSVVSADHTTYVKDHPSKTAAWRGTRGGHHGDWAVDKALTDGAQVLRIGNQVTGRPGSGDLTRIDWAAETRHFDGSVKHTSIGDEEYATFTADSMTAYLATLNEPTRRHNGVESVAIVRREARVLADGTQVIAPWRKVRDGQVPKFGEEEEANRG